MINSLSKEYLLFTMNNKGHLSFSNKCINFVAACITELYMHEFINIEDEKMYINKELTKGGSYLLPLYKVIKYSAAMKPKDLSDYFLANRGYFNDLFISVKSSLVEDNKTIELTTGNMFMKNKSYVIAKDEERIKVINEIKNMIYNHIDIDEVTIILLELLSESELLEKYFSQDEFNYLKEKSEKFNNRFVNETREGVKKRWNYIVFLRSLNY